MLKINAFTDVYFLRSVDILKKFRLNPVVRAQVFLRQGPGKIHGIDEVIELIKTNSTLFVNGGKVLALKEGDDYQSGESVLVIEGLAQDVIPLETVVLGVISAETTKANDHHDVDLKSVKERCQAITQLTDGRPVFYFGARHWRYDRDAEIAQAAFNGGAAGASTNVGAAVANKKGVGTIPHSLENIFAWKFGMDRAVAKSSKAFDKIIDSSIPRIALIDYRNKEVDDALIVARDLHPRLSGVRVDTAGENVMQGAEEYETKGKPFWGGKGVTISGVYHLRQKLDAEKFDYVKIFLSSGFGQVAKVKAFVEAEQELGVKLFDSLGVGGVFDARISTMDIVGVGETPETIQPISKVGRMYTPNKRLIHHA